MSSVGEPSPGAAAAVAASCEVDRYTAADCRSQMPRWTASRSGLFFQSSHAREVSHKHLKLRALTPRPFVATRPSPHPCLVLLPAPSRPSRWSGSSLLTARPSTAACRTCSWRLLFCRQRERRPMQTVGKKKGPGRMRCRFDGKMSWVFGKPHRRARGDISRNRHHKPAVPRCTGRVWVFRTIVYSVYLPRL